METAKKVWGFMKGYRLMLGVAIIFASKVYDAMNNGHSGDIVGSVLTVLGWMPTADGTSMGAIGLAAGSAVALFGFFAKVYVAQRQIKNGATVGEALTTKGYVKDYIAESQK